MANLTDELNHQIEKTAVLEKEVDTLKTSIRDYLREAGLVTPDEARYADEFPHFKLESITYGLKKNREANAERERVKKIVYEILNEEQIQPKAKKKS